MDAREFYDKRLKEDPNIGSVQLMEEYAKFIIEINFCDGSPDNFGSMPISCLHDVHRKIGALVAWVNT